MDQKGKEIITNKTSITTQSSGLASRGLQIANKLTEQNAKTVKQFIDEKYFTNSLGMKFRLIPAGTFIMGSPETEEDRDYEEDQHEVTISRAFWIGVHEVTQKQYEGVIGTNPSWFQGNNVKADSSNHPVEAVLWDHAVEFCKRLSEFPGEKKAGRVYRLPTEAEWEYACRAGTTTAFSFGESPLSLGDFAWYRENSDQTHLVGEKKPNAWGLYDMHGNVWEWCSDWYGEYPKRAVTDPIGPNVGSKRVLRGGRYFSVAGDCRSANRYGGGPWDIYSYIGFRVALSSSGIPM
jgi:formylglycine-generating enzyme required for sulfatase activity